MENLKDASTIAVIVISLVGFIKPFIPESKGDLIPGIAILIGVVIALFSGAEVVSVIDGIMGSLVGVATYKIGSTKLKSGTDEVKKTETDSGIQKLVETLQALKK